MDPLSLEIVNSSPQIVAPVEVKPQFSLLPSVPSIATQYVENKIKVDEGQLLSHFLSDRKTDKAGELYNYSTEQEKRYSNPYEQFTPNVQGSYSSEDVYGKNQGAGEQLYNSLIKFGGTAGATFISGFASIPNQIDAIRKGNASQLFETDSVFTETQTWLNELENKFPNYQTQVESDRKWYVNAFTPTGAANFWGDTIIKNAGFTLGAIANAIVTDAAIELATAGTATPAVMIEAGLQMSKAMKPLKAAFRALSKSAAVGKVDDVMGLATASQSLVKGLETTNQIWGLKKGSQFLATTYMSAQGEGMIEGYHTYIDTKTQLLKEADAAGKPFNAELLLGIEQSAAAAGKATTMMNVALLSASNMVQFPKILGWAKGSDVLEKVSGKYLGIKGTEAGLKAANTYNKKVAVSQVLKDFGLKGFLSEGLEEGSQYYTGNTISDYYLDKFNGESKKDMASYMLGAIPKTLADSQFWEETFIGGLSGMITGAAMPGGELQGSLKQNLFGAKAKNDTHVSALNNVLGKLNDSVAELTNLNEGITQTNKTDQFQTAYKNLHRAVTTAAKYDSLGNLKEGLSDLENLSLEEYNKTFFTDPQTGLKTEQEKIQAISRIRKEIDLIEKDAIEVEKVHTSNPFSDKKIKDLLEKKFKVDRSKVNGVANHLFENWKENQTFLIGRLRQTSGRVEDIKEEMRLGANSVNDDEFQALYTTLLTMGEGKALSTYLAHKNNHIQALRTQEELHKETGDKLKEASVRSSITRLQNLYNKIKVLDESKNPDAKNLIQALLIEEEFSPDQIKNIREQLTEAQEQSTIVDNSEEELVQSIDNPVAAAEQMVVATEAMVTAERNLNPAVTPVAVENTDVPEMGFATYNSLREVNPGTKISFNGEDFILTETTKTVVETEEGVKFLPEGYVVGSDLIGYKPTDVLVIYNSAKPEPQVTEEEPVQDDVVAQNQATLEKEKLAKLKEEFNGLIAGKEIVDTPRNIGGRYVRVSQQIGQDFYEYLILEKDAFRKVTVHTDKIITSPGVFTFDDPQKFYSIDGEPPVIVEPKAPDVEVVNPLVGSEELITPVENTTIQPIDLSKLPEYVQEKILELVEKAKKLNIIDGIIDLSSRGLTAAQIVTKLGLSNKPDADMAMDKDIVRAVRTYYGIPSLDDITEFKKWQEDYNESKKSGTDTHQEYVDGLEKQKKEEVQNFSIEEKINYFMKRDSSTGLRNVLLSSIQKGILNIQC